MFFFHVFCYFVFLFSLFVTLILQSTFRAKFNKKKDRINPDTIMFDKKCTQVAYHPSENVFAVGAGANVAIYKGAVEKKK